MKKRLPLILLWIGVSILLIGCRGNDVGADSTQVESTGMETESEIVKETESETDRAEDTDKLFAGYTVKDIDLSFLVEDMENLLYSIAL